MPEPTAPVEKLVLWNDVTDATGASLPAEASVYDGYLHDGSGNVKGTVQVKVAKPKNGTATIKGKGGVAVAIR